MVRTENKLAEMVTRWSSTKIVKIRIAKMNLIRQKFMVARMYGWFPLYGNLIKKKLLNVSSKIRGQN